MRRIRDLLRKSAIIGLLGAVLPAFFVPSTANAVRIFGVNIYSLHWYTDGAVDQDGNYYTFSTLGTIIDPPSSSDLTSLTISMKYNPSLYTFDQSLSGPLGVFSVGGDSPPVSPGVGVQPLQQLPSTGYSIGTPLPGSSLTYTVAGGVVTVNYNFAKTPVTTTGDVNAFYLDFDLVTPLRINGATSTVTYLAAGPGQFTQLAGSCTTVAGAGPCGSASPTVGTNFTFSIPEPTAWAMMLVGLGAVGAAMRFRRRGTVDTTA
jgi:PEP-CTERM motif